MKGISPTQVSLKHMRALGYTCQVVEHWNPFANRRVDLFGCIDIVCLSPENIVGVQTTSKTNMSARRKKIKEEPSMALWLEAGGKVELHGAYKENNRWKLVVEQVGV